MKKEQTYYDPPERILRLLRWFCKDDFLEEIEGDLYELFQEEVEIHGITKSKRRFLGNSIRYIRPYFFGKKEFLPNLQYHLTMFQHYLKIATRHLWKQRLYSVINIAGLAIGLACCIAVLFYVKDELSYDNYHQNADNIYRLSINSTTISSSNSNDRASSPILWGPALKRDYPEVEEYARFVRLVSPSNPWKFKVEEKEFAEQNVLYGDPSTFDLFNWKILHGDAKAALGELNSIILTKEMAYKYFNTENPVGQTITLDPRQRDRDGQYRVLSAKLKPNKIAEGISAVEAKSKQFAPEVDFEYNFLDEAFKEQYDYEQQLGQVLTATSILAILIACLGLFGLAAFMTAQRIKEIGIRKTLGASTSNIVFLLSKDFTQLVLLAVILAIPIGWYAINIGLENFAYRIENTTDIFILSLLLALLVAFLTVSFHTLKVARMNPADTLKTE